MDTEWGYKQKFRNLDTNLDKKRGQFWTHATQTSSCSKAEKERKKKKEKKDPVAILVAFFAAYKPPEVPTRFLGKHVTKVSTNRDGNGDRQVILSSQDRNLVGVWLIFFPFLDKKQ